jgi:hypothetical protein
VEGKIPQSPSTLRYRARSAANRLLAAFDLQLVRRSEADSFRGESPTTDTELETVPTEALAYLTNANPRLLDLRARYRRHPASIHSKWHSEFVSSSIDLRLFRRDNAYVYQTRQGISDTMYALTAYHVRQADPLGLWSVFTEDGAFGCHVVDFNGEKKVSRDLLDSILEISFLEEHLGLSRLNRPRFVDIGAGYGRLAHRLCAAFPRLGGVAADAIPESTFLSEFYLRHRGLEGRARAVPLDEIEAAVLKEPPVVATNIHSFSEMPRAAIAWWVQLMARAGVPNLMIVPNTGEDLLTTEPETVERGSGPLRREDFAPVLREAGYELVVKRAKYAGAPSLQAYGLFPTWYFLFRRA